MAALANPAFLYVGSDVYNSVTAWSALAVDAAGRLIRPLTAPAVGNERVYVATTGGTTGAAEPTWTFAKGDIQPADGSVVWQECTGQPAVNGDATNTLNWNSAKSNTVAKGQIIKNVAGTYYFICSIAGTSGGGAEPSWTLTAGVATVDNTVTWICIGTVGSFAAFAAPHARILNADAATWQTVAGNNNVYISASHAETAAAATTLTGGQGTAAKPNRYLCVPNNVAPPAAGSLNTGASIATTGAFALKAQNYGYYEGVNFSTGGGGANAANFTANAEALIFENCTFTLATTNATSTIVFTQNAQADSLNFLLNPTFVFGATGQKVNFGSASGYSRIVLVNGVFAATGSVPTTLFSNGGACDVIVRDSDMSAVTGTLFTGASTTNGFIRLENCKLGAAVTMTSGTFTDAGSQKFIMHNCDSGSKNYRFYEKDFLATIQSETTTVNNAGSSDGTTIVSWNIATSSATQLYQPAITEYLPLAKWIDTVGSPVTATVEIAGANQLTNADIWLEIEHLGNSSFPIGSVANNRVADILTTPVNVTTSAASWGGAPAFTQKLQITFTPQMKGWCRARIYIAKPSITVFVDPLLTIA